MGTITLTSCLSFFFSLFLSSLARSAVSFLSLSLFLSASLSSSFLLLVDGSRTKIVHRESGRFENDGTTNSRSWYSSSEFRGNEFPWICRRLDGEHGERHKFSSNRGIECNWSIESYRWRSSVIAVSFAMM